MIAAGWGGLETILTAIDQRVTHSETRFIGRLDRMEAATQREFTLVRADAKEMRNDIRMIRNAVVTESQEGDYYVGSEGE